MFRQGAFVNILRPGSMRWKDALKKIERFPSLGHVELWFEHIPRGDELRDIRNVFRNVPVIIHGPFIHTSLLSHLPEVVDVTIRRFRETVELASSMQARVVTFHAGPYPLFFERSEVVEMLAERFRVFSELTDPIATLENMPIKSHGTVREAIGKLADYDEVLRVLPDLRFTLDIGHCLQNEDNFISFIKRHSSRIENIHLHDGIAGGKGHLRLGDGSLDLEKFLDVLIKVGFDRNVSIETISSHDTSSSWDTLCKAELAKGIQCGHDVPPASFLEYF